MLIMERMLRALLALLAVMLMLPVGAATTSDDPADSPAAQDGVADKLPLQADRVLSLTLNEATWLSLDVASYGQRMVIEVLGDLYELDIDGGLARPLTQGMAFDTQPAYSPDGQSIAFVSDRGGSDDLWLLASDAAEPRKLSATGKMEELASPTWSPDGKHVVVSKSSWTQHTFELWAYPVDGGTGVRLTQAKPKASTPSNRRHNALGAVYDASGRYLYYATKRGGFGYNLNFPLWQIARKDLITGAEDVITAAAGSAIRPVLSPNGRWLVYGTRYKHQTGLRIRNLASGFEEWLAYPVQRDEQESRFTRDLLPGYAFTPDSRAVITTREGGIIRVDIASKEVSPIPFTVAANVPVRSRLAFTNRIGVGPVKARILAEPRLSPDGRRVAFASLSRIYVHDLDSGKTQAISPPEISAGMPTWSPDGRDIAYAGWSDGEGALYRQRARSGARVKKLTPTNGYFSFPSWSPDGQRIVALRGLASVALEREYVWGQTTGADVVWLDADGGETQQVLPARGFSYPHFGPEADRIYLYIGTSTLPRNNKTGLISVRFDGSDRREHLAATGMGTFTGGNKGNPEFMAISPSGEHVLMKHAAQLYLARPIPHLTGQTVNLSKASVPLTRLTDVGADFTSWSADGRTLVWTSGDQLFTRAVHTVEFKAATDDEANGEHEAEDESAVEDTEPQTSEPRESHQQLTARSSADEGTDTVDTLLEEDPSVAVHQVDIYLPRAVPTGTLALTGARLLTMSEQGVIEQGTVVVRDNRIEAVGAAGSVEIPADAHVIDLAGQTIAPGFVDTHAHFRISRQLYDSSEYSMLANLAYGVTTGMDVQPSTVDLLDVQDRIDAGQMLGPRALSTGPGVFSNNDFNSQAHAVAILKRYKERYRVDNIKAYISGSRQQRQWLIQAAAELKLMPTTEGALDMKLDLTHAIDGFSGLEHAFPVPHLYDDVIQLAAQTGIAYTPTLLVNFGGPSGENWFYTHESPYQDAKLRRFLPYQYVARRTLRRQWFHPTEYVTDITASSARRIVDAGGQVGVGAHGQLQGLGYHWELWALAAGGFDNYTALRAATLMGAEMLGIDTDIGSIEVGKLADLVVMRKNPLENIRHTNTLSHVVINGQVLNADTLDQVWPQQRPLPEQWWWTDQAEILSRQSSGVSGDSDR